MGSLPFSELRTVYTIYFQKQVLNLEDSSDTSQICYCLSFYYEYSLCNTLYFSWARNQGRFMRITQKHNVQLYWGNSNALIILLQFVSFLTIKISNFTQMIIYIICYNHYKYSSHSIVIRSMQQRLTKLSQIFIITMLILIGQVFTNFLFITMNAQLYIPSHRYSSIDIQFDISKVETQLFDISLTFQLNQTSPYNQTNTIFDFLASDFSQKKNFIDCYKQNFNYIQTKYEKREPCYQVCDYSQVKTFREQNMLPQLLIDFTSNRSLGHFNYIVDNTFYPCKGGAFQPQLYLDQIFSINIQANQTFSTFLKLTFVLLLQLMIIIIAYLIIMFRKYRKLKKRLQYLKGQLEAQDLLNSFLINNK